MTSFLYSLFLFHSISSPSVCCELKNLPHILPFTHLHPSPYTCFNCNPWSHVAVSTAIELTELHKSARPLFVGLAQQYRPTQLNLGPYATAKIKNSTAPCDYYNSVSKNMTVYAADWACSLMLEMDATNGFPCLNHFSDINLNGTKCISSRSKSVGPSYVYSCTSAKTRGLYTNFQSAITARTVR